jgi:3-oxoacyl-[acyl-carrier protein] reductase
VVAFHPKKKSMSNIRCCTKSSYRVLHINTPTDKAKSVADSINKAGGQAIAAPGDMLDDKYLDSLVKQAADFGNGKIHIIVNNAGYTWDGVIHKVRSALSPP